MIVDIKDVAGNLRFSTPINKGSKRKLMLMKEDYITLKFSLDDPVYFQLGDRIDNELGIFELIDLHKPIYNASTGGYDYELRLDAYYWKWKNKKFFYTPGDAEREADWNLTATLNKHLDIFLDNLKALGYKFREDDFIWNIDGTVENASKLVSYSNVNLIDALTQMAETWECEWWIDNHKICFGRCEFSSPVDFKVGDFTDTENVNVNSMQRSDSQTTFATRVYAFGSTKNIPDSYRKSLIFDVKKASGREISDTARSLDVKYFPNSVSFKDEYHIKKDFGSSYSYEIPEYFDSLVTASAYGGTYQIISSGIKLSVACVTLGGLDAFGMPIIKKSPLPPGDYTFKASFVYLSNDVQKEIVIGEQTTHIRVNQQYEYSVTLSLPDRLEIEKGVADLSVRTYISTPSFFGKGNLGFAAQYEIDLINGSSASTSVTFLSGRNEGKTFDAVYNPDLLTGDDANVIRLPEGVTASLGDRYTINNIIKGKVPDNYFTKDDKETTLNGVVQKRLMLPDGIPYVDAYRYSPAGERIDIGDEHYDDPDNVEMPKEEAIEEIVIFEDEYPKYIGNTDVVPKPKPVDEKDDKDKTTGKQYLVYTFKDNGLKNFNQEDFAIAELRMVFQTGKLAGLDFAVNVKESDDNGTTFEIVPNEDYGRRLPDDTLLPQAAHTEDGKLVPADTYILHGFDTAFISEQMLPDAEQGLFNKAKEYVKKSMVDPSTYNCTMDCEYIYNKGDIRMFELGDKVNLINKAYFENGRQSRIIGLEWPLDIPYDHPIYTIGETAAYSRIGEIEGKLDSLTYKGQAYSGVSGVGGGNSVYVIGVNDKTLPSDRNVLSSKRTINEIKERSISKVYDDNVTGHIDFEKGLTSKELVEADNGLVVRKHEIVEANLMSIVEESEDALIEEFSISGNVSTLGELDNVSSNANGVSETNDILVRLIGAQEWSINTTLFAQVAQLMGEVFPFTINLIGGGIYEKGSSQTINLSWTYDRDIEMQTVNKEILGIGDRAKQYTGVTKDTTYILRAVFNDETYSKSVSAQFCMKKYYGVSEKEALTNEEILTLSSEWAQNSQDSIQFDCTGGKYPYYILPTSMVANIEFRVGGLRNSDWIEEVRDVTNASGYTESYTIFRLNSIQTGVLKLEVRYGNIK